MPSTRKFTPNCSSRLIQIPGSDWLNPISAPPSKTTGWFQMRIESKTSQQITICKRSIVSFQRRLSYDNENILIPPQPILLHDSQASNPLRPLPVSRHARPSRFSHPKSSKRFRRPRMGHVHLGSGQRWRLAELAPFRELTPSAIRL